MTREEASKILQGLKMLSETERCEIALDMAISALSVPEREKGTETFGFREATKEERESVDKYIKSISFPEREKGTDADIMECARAMKEYCEKYAENCEGCPFKSKKVNVWCELGASTLPCDWDLPEPYKGGEV